MNQQPTTNDVAVDRAGNHVCKGDTVRSGRGRGDYIAQVASVRDGRIRFNLLKYPADAMDPLMSWSVRLEEFKQSCWIKIRVAEGSLMRPRISSEACKRILGTHPDNHRMVVQRLQEGRATQIRASSSLPASVTPMDLVLELALKHLGLLPTEGDTSAVGVVTSGKVLSVVRLGDWVVQFDDGHVGVFEDEVFQRIFGTPGETSGSTDFISRFEQMMHFVHRTAVEKGWWPETGRNDAEMIALMHSELSEALEGLRKKEKDKHVPSMQSVEVEFADVIIRIMDMAAGRKLRVAEAIVRKANFNTTRPHRHGNLAC